MKEITREYINLFFLEKKELQYLQESVEKAIEALSNCVRSGNKIYLLIHK